MDDLLNLLSKPFSANQIHWRVGSTTKDNKRGMALAYLDARDVMDRLDAVVGNNWSDSYQEVAGRVVCSITINGVTRSDGAGDTQVEAEKGGLSDAFKRAAVKYGIGRYLYRLDSEWVALDSKRRIVKPPTLPDWALPDDNTPLTPTDVQNILDGDPKDIPFDQLQKDDAKIEETKLSQTQADLIEGIMELENALVSSDRLTAETRTRVRTKYANTIKLEAATEKNLKAYYAQLTDFQRSN
jgi:hypothetical protein